MSFTVHNPHENPSMAEPGKSFDAPEADKVATPRKGRKAAAPVTPEPPPPAGESGEENGPTDASDAA
jgi:hypothetical protein